ncbi:Bcr/CflA family efflux MFS transporter [Ectopseudomonas hydrolytica]|uniref:Bcr/CflA family efflux MFS transporter n=1 Tax=Ectopseudomonas hydrolytica TaxID=2493633 RepID=UPI0018A721EF|nr:Bcr/CflA family efflux MFS transporter [Pseudomonas hydrolytica]MBF8163815.1 Bcr/CflA family efflux MFS transporter [Pseudomonas mendocina]UTH32803.1 Bcr/CflA family efflux MFS transporter [Pseudomonas hydrolytica]UZZ11977.1 Bcr/CflA family efflux MFS transporter [Pseudomonas mendocina]
MRPSRLLLLILMLLTALGEISTQLLIPALGALERGLHAVPGSSLLALTLFVAAFGLGQLFFGPLSDRLGRRPVLLAGLSLYLLASLGMLLAENIQMLIAARVLQGFGACAALVLARAIVRDVWQAEAGPALALTVLGMFTAIVLSPLLGGLLTQYGGWRAPLVASLVVGSVALLAVLGGYRESHVQRDPQAGRLSRLAGDYRDLLRSCRALALTIAATYGAMFVVVAGSSAVYIGLLGLTAAQYGMTFAAIVSGLLGGALFTLRNVQRLGPQRVVAIGGALVLTGAFLTLAIYLLFGLSLLGLSLPQMLVTLGGGMVLPAAVAGAVIPNPQRAGLAAGLMGFAQMAGATLGGLLLTWLQDGSAWPMVALHALFAALAFAGFHLLRARPIPIPEARRVSS